MRTRILVCAILFLVACDPSHIDPGEIEEQTTEPQGTLLVDFPITHVWIPVNRIIRTELHIAENALEMYRGNFIQSANVTNSQEYYTFYLAPGKYYLEAAIACICEGDSCSAGGFPGNKWGEKHTSYDFTIIEDERTEITIRFLQ